MTAHQKLLHHVVFSTKERRPILQNDQFRGDVWAYMAGDARNLDGIAIRVGGYDDLTRLLVRIPAKIAVCDFVGKPKANTSKHINESRDAVIKFHWQGDMELSPSVHRRRMPSLRTSTARMNFCHSLNGMQWITLEIHLGVKDVSASGLDSTNFRSGG